MNFVERQHALSLNERWLRTVVLARVGERAAVDEVMQELSLAALRNATPPLDSTKLAPWLYRLAVRQSLLYRRKAGRRRKLTDRYAERLAADGEARGAEPLEWLLAAERRTLVRQALGQLAPRDREILLLKYSEGWSCPQLAARQGLSLSAVETRLHRARARLRLHLVALEPAAG